jgi:hypothetical protein
MATKKEIIASLHERYGDTLNAKQVLAVCGIHGHSSGKAFLDSLDSFTLADSGRRRFLAIDVANAIYKRQERVGSK